MVALDGCSLPDSAQYAAQYAALYATDIAVARIGRGGQRGCFRSSQSITLAAVYGKAYTNDINEGGRVWAGTAEVAGIEARAIVAGAAPVTKAR